MKNKNAEGKNKRQANLTDNTNPDKLTPGQARQTKKYCVLDGCAYQVMYGFGEQFVNPYAIKLGATNSELGILSSVPAFIGSVFQLLGAKVADKYKDRKKITLFFTLLQALSLIPLFALPLITKNMLVMTALFALYYIFGNAGAPAWNSWIGDVVEDRERARYFSMRARIVAIALFFSILLAGIILNFFSSFNVWLGFGVLFGIAVIGRLGSYFFLTKHFEPKYVVDEKHSLSLRDFIRNITKNNFGNFVLFRSLLAFSIMIAFPFFAVFELKEMGFSYIQYTAIALIPLLIRFFTMKYWGRYAEKFGNRNIMYVTTFIICLLPLNWFLIGTLFHAKFTVFMLLLIEEAISGFGWGGFEMTSYNYMLENSKPEKRARSFAYFTAFWGTGVLVGGIVSSFLAKVLPAIVLGFEFIMFMFLLSFVLRIIVAIAFIPKMKDGRRSDRIPEGELFFELTISKPIDFALNTTVNLFHIAGKGFEKMGMPGKATVSLIKEPFEPIISNAKYYFDGMATKVEQEKKNKKRKNKGNRQ